MLVMLLWVYIHTGHAWKICLAKVGIEPTTYGILATLHQHSKYQLWYYFPNYVKSWPTCQLSLRETGAPGENPRLSAERWRTLFTWVRSENLTHDLRGERRLLWRLRHRSGGRLRTFVKRLILTEGIQTSKREQRATRRERLEFFFYYFLLFIL
jgi:hypothetical protein